MRDILSGTVAVFLCGASLIDGSKLWLLGVAVGFGFIIRGIKTLKKQD